MNAVGITAEYNPFHNGHRYHLKKSIELTGADVSVAVMSGNFVQRGECACADKWARAEMAVRGGIDLVFELPFAYAVNNAEYFAKGAVRLLNGLGCIDFISFGSEEGSLARLSAAADILADENSAFKELLKENLRSGVSYPKARAEALSVFLNNADFLRSSNNILAIEYLKQLRLTNSEIKPVTVGRTGGTAAEYLTAELPNREISGDADAHGGKNTAGIASASAIRASIAESLDFIHISPFVPGSTLDILKSFYIDVNSGLNNTADTVKNISGRFYELTAYKILTSSSSEIADIFAVSEGLENRLAEAVRTSGNTESLISSIISKRYTETRIRRVLTQLLVGLKREDMLRIDSACAMYGRVLGFSDKGARFLKEIKKSGKCKVPIITNINKDRPETEEKRLLLSYDLRASDVYNLLHGRNIYDHSDYVRTPFIPENQTVTAVK